MPIHYLYPNTDYSNSGFYGYNLTQDTVLWNKINNGVLAPDDSTHIYNTGYLVTGVMTPFSSVGIDDFQYQPEESSAISVHFRSLYTGVFDDFAHIVLGVLNSNHEHIVPDNSYVFSVNEWNTGYFYDIYNSSISLDGPYIRFAVNPDTNFLPSSLFISEIEVRYSGNNLLPKNNDCTFYLQNIGDINSGIDFYVSGGYFADSGLLLSLPICTKEYRLQPLYDNEYSPNPEESGYPAPLYINDGSHLYNGINSEQRWGFYSTTLDALCSDKYHFAVDDDFFEFLGCSGQYFVSSVCVEQRQKDFDLIYTKPPVIPVNWNGLPSNGYVYFYEDYSYYNSDYESRSAISFRSRPYLEDSDPFSARLRFRADVDTRFKLLEAWVSGYDYHKKLYLPSATILDGYGVCGPYELELSAGNNIGWTGHNDTQTLIHAKFTVDEECLSDCFYYPTGLTNCIQSTGVDAEPFRQQYFNHQTYRYYTMSGYIEETVCDSGINNFLIHSENISFLSQKLYKNTFGYEFAPISGIVNKKYLGIKIDSLYIDNQTDVPFLNFYIYEDYNSGNNFITNGSFDFDVISNNINNYISYGSGSVTFWKYIGKNLDGISGIQVGFYLEDIGNNEYLDILLNSEPFIYEDKTGAGYGNIGVIKISQLDVAFEVPCTPTGINDNITLYTVGHIVSDSGITLYTSGGTNDSMPLYTSGAYFARSDTEMYINGNTHGDMPLYIKGFGGTETQTSTLYIDAQDSGVDYGSISNTLTLFTKSIPLASGDGLNLYIAGPESGFLSDYMSLTVNNTDEWVVKYSGFNMYLRALESNNSGVNMFIKTQESYDYSGDLSLHIFGTGVFSSNSNSDLYIGGKSQPDGNINLFLAVAAPDSGGTNLYIKGWGGTAIKEMALYTEGYGGTVSGVTELFILGPNPDKMSGDMSFFIEGGGTDDRGQSVDLHTVGSIGGGYLNSVPMYTIGGFDIGEMPLYLENQQQYSSLAASTDLYVNGFDGTSIEGIFGSSASMYTFGSGSSNQVNLVIVNSGMSSLAQQMPITMVGRDIIYDSTTNGFELSIHNYFDLLTSGIELFMYSQQNYNSSGDMNLYMSRSVESAAMRTDMYVSGPLGENNAFNMYINGGTDSYDSVTLCLPSSVGFEMKKLNTYVHGF